MHVDEKINQTFVFPGKKLTGTIGEELENLVAVVTGKRNGLTI